MRAPSVVSRAVTALTPQPEAEAVPFALPSANDDDVAAVERVLRSGWWTTGMECHRLEEALASYLTVRHAVAVSSCTAALEISYAFLGQKPGARVGVPTWTFASSALAPFHHGAVPVLLDVDPASLNLCPRSLEAALGEGLDAVVAVHFGGVPVAREVHELCASAGVPLIEDAAHALGARDHRGQVAGQGNVAACLSFYASKNLPAGEGGAILTDDDKLVDYARSFRLHGLSKDAWQRYEPGRWAQYDLVAPGIKANLPDLLAALALSQLDRFKDMQSTRRVLVRRYRERLCDVAGLQPVPTELDERGADHLMVVELPDTVDRDAIIQQLGQRRIGTSVHFQPLHRFGWFHQHSAIGPSGVDGAEAMADRVLSLPLSASMRLDQVDRVCDELISVIDR